MNTIVTQALATGMPVIATKHSGLPEQVIDNLNGVLARENDIVDLAEKILYIFDHAELWAAMGEAGRAHVKANYDASTLIQRQIEYYQYVVQTA